ncbi:hypothetical protein PDR5_26580 [Pseudomonas sp. DR 5-09]|nr:hypothetical protein PDR5_26580 [Pseudomonas sp. DR 5-09]
MEFLNSRRIVFRNRLREQDEFGDELDRAVRSFEGVLKLKLAR